MKNIAVKHYLVLGVSTRLAIILAGCTQISEAEQHFNAGLELYEQGHLEEAIVEYDEAIRLNPQLTLAYHNRGFAYASLGEYQRATSDYDEAIRLNPEHLQTYTDEQMLFSISYPQGWEPALSSLAELEEITK